MISVSTFHWAYVPVADVIQVAKQVIFKQFQAKVDPKWLEVLNQLDKFHEYSQHWVGKPKFNVV